MLVPGPDHPIVISPHPERVRVLAAGAALADTRQALSLAEAGYPPVAYIPRADVDTTRLSRTAHHTTCPYKGEASYYTLIGDGRQRENVAWSYEEAYPAMEAIRGHLAFYDRKVDRIEGF